MHVQSLCAAYLPWFPHAQHGDQALSQHLLHFARNGIVVILRKERSVFICYDEKVPRWCVKYNIPLRCVTVDTIQCHVIQHNAVCFDTLLQYNTIQCNTSQYMMMQHCIMLRSRLEWSVILSLIGCCPTYFTSSFLFDCFLFTPYATWHLDVCTFHLLLNKFPPNYHYVLILPTMTLPSVVMIFPLSSPGIGFCVPSVRTVRTWRPRPLTCTLTPHPCRRLV